jgi:hypothetical protein
MDGILVTNDEPRKEWTAPELKKVDVEQITAANLKKTKFDKFGLS